MVLNSLRGEKMTTGIFLEYLPKGSCFYFFTAAHELILHPLPFPGRRVSAVISPTQATFPDLFTSFQDCSLPRVHYRSSVLIYSHFCTNMLLEEQRPFA